MSDDERAEKEQSHFYNGIHSHDRVPIFAVSSANTTMLLVVFVSLILLYGFFIASPWPPLSSGLKDAVDNFVGRVSKFILVAFVVILILDLWNSSKQEKKREIASLKKRVDELESNQKQNRAPFT